MKKKLISLFTAAVMVLGMTVPAMAESTEGSMKGKLVVIHTNDIHGYFEKSDEALGMSGVVGLKDYYEAQGADVLLFDAGDFAQGNTLVSYYRGKNASEYIAAAGYDAISMGNHEFDYTFDELLDNMKVLTDAGVKIVDANVINKETGKAYFDANVIFEKGGMKIGVFGLNTAETLTKASPNNVKYVSFLDKEDMFKVAQAQVDELKAAGCDYIIALTHLGVDEESIGRRSTDVASAVKGIDLIVDGHSHTVMDGGVKVGDSLIVSTGSYLANAGTVVIDETSHDTTAKIISAADYAATVGKYDEKVDAIVAEDVAEVNAAYSKIFAKTEVKLEGTKSLVRSQETNLGDFTADAYLYTAQKYADEHELGINIDCAISNGGGIRTTVEPGDISMDTLVTIFPFGNNVSIVTITGTQLLEILEASTFCTPETLGGFPQVAGIKYTLDTTVPYENGTQYPDSTYYAPAKPGSRVTIESVNGKAFDPNANYTVSVNSFQAEGGDTYYQLTQGSYTCDTEILDCDALIQYVQHLNNVIGQEYAEPQGRITIISAPATAEPETETPVVETPVEETPVVETPATETPVVDTPTVAPIPTTEELYTVAKGDSLWKIAAVELGDGTLWNSIYENNKSTISDPNKIYIGQKLVLSK